jgi:hypothetical protein
MKMLEAGSAPGAAPAPDPAYREVRYEHSRNFPALLEHLGASLLVSTYQAGKLFVVGARQGELTLSFHNFEKAMGVAVRRDRLAVGTRNQVWTLRGAPDVAPRLAPAGTYDGCFLARTSHFTGDVHGHELAWGAPHPRPLSPEGRGGQEGRPLSPQGRGAEESELWLVNTLFSCLCTLHPDYSFVPRWRPPFVTALAPEDRCHLNGLALAEGRPLYVTALGETDTAQGWRAGKATGGCLVHVPTGRTLVRGLAMPHSPRVYRGRVWLLDSGTGRLVAVNPAGAAVETVAELPGYTRGLAFQDDFAFVGLSPMRETSTFGGLPLARRLADLRCGVAVVDLRTGGHVARLEFQSGVEEIFAVAALPGVRCPAVSGPYPDVDGVPTVWSAPDASPVPPNTPKEEE